MPRSRNDLLHGTLDVLILKALADRPRHGYDIARHVVEATGGAVVVEDGSLYPALYRLEKKGRIRGEWGVSDAGRRARFYRLTDPGRRALARQTATWAKFSAGVSRLLLGGRSAPRRAGRS
jgi:transcriptional regulator